MGLVRVAPIGAAGANDADWWLLGQHRADLHGTRMGAQELALALGVGFEKERIVHLARGMAGREIELGEIQVVTLDVRPFGDRNPISAKMAVISSITWLIGWMRPVSTPLNGTGSVTSTVSRLSCASRPMRLSTARRAVSAAVT